MLEDTWVAVMGLRSLYFRRTEKKNIVNERAGWYGGACDCIKFELLVEYDITCNVPSEKVPSAFRHENSLVMRISVCIAWHGSAKQFSIVLNASLPLSLDMSFDGRKSK